MSTGNKRLHSALINCYLAHKRRCFQEFNKLNLSTGQPKVLTILYHNEGCLQKDLAKLCKVEPATMTSLLNNMIRKDLVYKKMKYVSGGKRAYSIYLTELGREMALNVLDIVDTVEEVSLQNFNEDDIQLLINLLTRIQANIENDES